MTNDTDHPTDDSTASDSPVSIADRLRARTHPLATTDPAAPLDDLEPVVDRLADARVIGLGEATHGTHEFVRLKHRILRALVEDCDLRLVALEATLPESLALNEYVRHGDGTAERALAATRFWIHATEETRDLIEWLRTFNHGRPATDRVAVHGVDAQWTAGAAAGLSTFLDRADPALAAELASDLRVLDDDGAMADDPDVVAERLDAAGRVTDRIGERLDARTAEYAAATGGRAVDRARRLVRVLEQATARKRAIRVEDGYERAMRIRDRALAENTAWLLEYATADRIALWAHDCHVCRTTNRASGTGATAPAAGRHLAEWFGRDYYALGFDFLAGSFRAVSETADGWERGTYSLDGPPADSVTRRFAETEEDRAFLRLRSLPAADGLAEWITEPHTKRSLGAVYYGADGPDDGDRDGRATHNARRVLSEAFDGLVFVRETTPTQPLDTGESGR